jgi:ATP-dependent Clp protease ATP-binding subunit ClpA
MEDVMFEEKWNARHITDSAQRILRQIPSRAGDRGLAVVDDSSIVMLALWSLLLWERKVGRAALEQMGVDAFDLARGVDRLLEDKAREHPVAYNPETQQLVLVRTRQPYRHWDFDALLEPLLQQAEHESLELGHNWVGSEHLLLAVVRLADPTLSQVLRRHSVEHGPVKEAVLGVLRS